MEPYTNTLLLLLMMTGNQEGWLDTLRPQRQMKGYSEQVQIVGWMKRNLFPPITGDRT